MPHHQKSHAGRRTVRLAAIKAHIAKHLRQRDLSVTAVAARYGITPRYVQMLFEPEGTSFSKFVLEQRLVLAHILLADPRTSTKTIRAIAVEAGFGDVSYFNRAFRRRYGASPTRVRQTARLPQSPRRKTSGSKGSPTSL